MSVCQIGTEDRTERGYQANRDTDALQRDVSQSEKQSNTRNTAGRTVPF